MLLILYKNPESQKKIKKKYGTKLECCRELFYTKTFEKVDGGGGEGRGLISLNVAHSIRLYNSTRL